MNESSRPHDEELISAYLDGELSGDELSRVEQLLHDDAELRQAYAELCALRESLQGLPRHGLDEGFAKRVLRRAERTSLMGEDGSNGSGSAELGHGVRGESRADRMILDDDTLEGPANRVVTADVRNRAHSWRRRVTWCVAVCATAIVLAMVLPQPQSRIDVALESKSTAKPSLRSIADDGHIKPAVPRLETSRGTADTDIERAGGGDESLAGGLEPRPNPELRKGNSVATPATLHPLDPATASAPQSKGGAGSPEAEQYAWPARGDELRTVTRPDAEPSSDVTNNEVESTRNDPAPNGAPIAGQPASQRFNRGLAGDATVAQHYWVQLARSPAPSHEEVPDWLADAAASNNTDLILQINLDTSGRAVEQVNSALIRNGIEYDTHVSATDTKEYLENAPAESAKAEAPLAVTDAATVDAPAADNSPKSGTVPPSAPIPNGNEFYADVEEWEVDSVVKQQVVANGDEPDVQFKSKDKFVPHDLGNKLAESDEQIASDFESEMAEGMVERGRWMYRRKSDALGFQQKTLDENSPESLGRSAGSDWGLVVVEGPAPQVLQAIQDIQSDESNRWAIQVRVPPNLTQEVAEGRVEEQTFDANQQVGENRGGVSLSNRSSYRNFHERNIVDRFAADNSQAWMDAAATRAKAYVEEPVRRASRMQQQETSNADGALDGRGQVSQGANEALVEDYVRRRNQDSSVNRQLPRAGRAFVLPQQSSVGESVGKRFDVVVDEPLQREASGGRQWLGSEVSNLSDLAAINSANNVSSPNVRALIVLRRLPDSMLNSGGVVSGPIAAGAAVAEEGAQAASQPTILSPDPTEVNSQTVPPVPGPVDSSAPER